jgi:hypothetical protein
MMMFGFSQPCGLLFKPSAGDEPQRTNLIASRQRTLLHHRFQGTRELQLSNNATT